MQKAIYLEENIFNELNNVVKNLNISMSDFIIQREKKGICEISLIF